MNPRIVWPLVAIAGIWLSVLAISLFARDMISGSQQDHLPLAALVTWIPGAVATRIVINTMLQRAMTPTARMGIATATILIWIVVAVVAILGPELVTGSDPTRIPVAAVLAPIGGAVVTAFVGDFVRLLTQGDEPGGPAPT